MKYTSELASGGMIHLPSPGGSKVGGEGEEYTDTDSKVIS
jgi:hypothetical protein